MSLSNLGEAGLLEKAGGDAADRQTQFRLFDQQVIHNHGKILVTKIVLLYRFLFKASIKQETE